MKHKKRITEVILHPEDGDIYDENAISIKLTDEGGGKFFVICNVSGIGSLRVEMDEMQQIAKVCKEMYES